MCVYRIAALCGALFFATAVQATDEQVTKKQTCEVLGPVIIEICGGAGKDELACVHEDMEKSGLVDGKDYTVDNHKLACK
jgi:hypothetical protein